MHNFLPQCGAKFVHNDKVVLIIAKSFFNFSNPKSFYSHVRSKAITNKDKVRPLKYENGKIIIYYSSMCEMFNSHFGSVFSAENWSEVLLEVKEIFKGDSSAMLTFDVSEEIVKF